jgi:hypothetical protein
MLSCIAERRLGRREALDEDEAGARTARRFPQRRLSCIAERRLGRRKALDEDEAGARTAIMRRVWAES